ncbi:hypothetical protein AMTR_s00077p00193480 [Amborella trichopoda]|uniref:Uncharacterized protein n=1 Tax=Amborella trichopoda TaxID=13333 RepID=W1P9H3_AMBTC|nr:hypothetical protein AMTR_s00077p00193480 [Amborella trichopoda]
MACWAGSTARWKVAKRGALNGVGAQRRREECSVGWVLNKGLCSEIRVLSKRRGAPGYRMGRKFRASYFRFRPLGRNFFYTGVWEDENFQFGVLIFIKHEKLRSSQLPEATSYYQTRPKEIWSPCQMRRKVGPNNPKKICQKCKDQRS